MSRRRTIDTLFSDVRSVLFPPPKVNLSGYAEMYRVLPISTSAKAGKWKNLSYQVEIQDAISSPYTSECVLMCSSQTGKSEILINTAFYYSDVEPSPIMIVQPQAEMLSDFMKNRLSASITNSKRLSQIYGDQIKPDKGRGKYSGSTGSVIYGGSAGSVPSLATRPVRVMLLDEIDLYKLNSSQGSLVALAVQRTQDFKNRKILYISTPGVKSISEIYKLYMRSDQGILQVMCLNSACETNFDLLFDTLKYEFDELEEVIEDSVHIVCPHCSHEVSEMERGLLTARCSFRIRNPKSKIRGFNFNVMAGEAVSLYELVKQYEDVKDDPIKYQTFVNTKLGLPFDDTDVFEGAGRYDERLEDYGVDTVPDAVLFITAGVDLQADRNEITYWGWGLNGQIYHLGYDVVSGGANDAGFRKLYEHLIVKHFTTITKVEMGIDMIGLDTSAFTKPAYDFCRGMRQASKGKLNVFPMKGSSGGEKVPIFPLKRGKREVYIVGGHQAKDKIYGQLKITNPEIEGFIHFSRELTNDNFFDQLHSERKVLIEKNSRVSYRYDPIDLNKARNEVLDTFVYALAAYVGVSPNLQVIQLNRDARAKKIHQETVDLMLKEKTLRA